MANVILDNVKKTYPNGFKAVQGANFTITEGEFIVLVGPSGCGKSTLLRMVAGLEDITEGALSIGGRVVNDVDPADRDIAMVFQNYALYPHMTVRKNIGYGLKNRGVAAENIEGKVNEAAKMLDLEPYLDRKPSQLSGGQRQRVAMGRAVVRDPSLFLFDEPLSNLDAKLRNQMRIDIKALQRRLGVTSIYVTHDQVEAMTMADRIIVLNGGEIEQIGTPAEIYHSPQSVFVASFMGAPPMNLMDAQVEKGVVRTADGQILAHSDVAADGPVVFGVRPEDVDLTGTDLTVQIDIVEELGAHRLLHGTLGGQAFSVHVPKSVEAEAGEHRISFKPNAVHLFDKQTGRAL